MKKIVLIFTLFISVFTVFAQPTLIKGVLLSSNDGLPLPGGIIEEVGKKNMVSTNLEGEFEILMNLDKEACLEFAYMGFESKMVKITPDESYYKVSIAEITETMEIVINTGYDVKPERNIGCAGLGRIRYEDLKIEGIPQVKLKVQ
ncbi:carboxypeptidase-like regulatory domain-containing protein [Flavobacterium sp. NKUCC04_CG]|uniref:carboxypeptidase-like regulatory domain-containing protein n=1 Tax=Flavobacterium sp. NKUCC04_CG TaxID=2842121 RepID=UPI001C5B9136|nr:carboxypeptidase-like regulatory domain-containing protein [Flavobacterium sp. NKUCC04_CG]MBW3519537.1 carboxypeptidase-like regulatory domain-containing protein [Flavobacterium sp. NKUCC04_CG]